MAATAAPSAADADAGSNVGVAVRWKRMASDGGGGVRNRRSAPRVGVGVAAITAAAGSSPQTGHSVATLLASPCHSRVVQPPSMPSPNPSSAKSRASHSHLVQPPADRNGRSANRPRAEPSSWTR